MTENRYKGTCVICGGFVGSRRGYLEKRNGKYIVYCSTCYFHADDKKDHSGQEDRECGDMAYEDRCAQQCGF
jgi:hypothetical protein